MLKSEQDEHEYEFDSYHTKRMLRSVTRELSEMKKEVSEMKEEIREYKATKQELEDLKGQFETTQTKLADKEECNVEQKNVIERFTTLIQFADVKKSGLFQIPKELFERLGEEEQKVDPKLLEQFTYEGKKYCFVDKISSFLTLDYEGRMKKLLSKMKIGEIYYIEDGRRLIFKLYLVENRNLLVGQGNPSSYNSYKNSRSYGGNPYDWIFGNTYFAVFYYANNSQYVVSNIGSFNNTNSVMYIHNVKKHGQRRQLAYDNYIQDIDWNEYKTDDKFVLFELTMK